MAAHAVPEQGGDQRRLNRQRQRRGRENAQLMPPAVQQLLLGRMRDLVARRGIPDWSVRD